MRIDVHAVLRQRMPRLPRFLTSPLAKVLARVIHQDELNQLLLHMAQDPGVGAADNALADLGITVALRGQENLPPAERRCIFASNHPLGGLDGLALISSLGHHYQGNIAMLVNDLLMAVQPLQPVFLPVNKYGRQGRAAMQQVAAELQGGKQIATFPAGLCSRRQPNGRIADLQWNKSLVTQAVNSRRDVVPIYFEAQNSGKFYRMAQLRKRLGLKFNYELVMLPGEMFKQRGAHFNIHIGKPIAWSTLDASSPREQAQQLRTIAYAMAVPNSTTTNHTTSQP